MRYFALLAIALTLSAGAALAQDKKKEPVDAPPAEKVDPAKTKADYSYAIGLTMGRRLLRDGIDIEFEQMMKGYKDALTEAKPAMTDAECRAAFEKLDALMQAKNEAKSKEMAAKAKVIGEKNKKEGDAFLAANKKKEGVTTLPSGLQYKVLKAGKGASPKPTDTVNTHYHGTLIDGKVFDSSVERGEPVAFQVNRVTPGWTEALQKLKVGDKWQLVIPSELAYAERGAGDDIGPNSVLVFEVELLGIDGADKEKDK